MEEKPLTFSQLVEYTEKSLVPQLEEKLVNKREFNEFKDKIYKDIDSLIVKADKLIQENEIRNYQERKQKEFFAILVKSLKEHNILSKEQLEKIAKLDMF
jgi:mevalonate kinase